MLIKEVSADLDKRNLFGMQLSPVSATAVTYVFDTNTEINALDNITSPKVPPIIRFEHNATKSTVPLEKPYSSTHEDNLHKVDFKGIKPKIISNAVNSTNTERAEVSFLNFGNYSEVRPNKKLVSPKINSKPTPSVNQDLIEVQSPCPFNSTKVSPKTRSPVRMVQSQKKEKDTTRYNHEMTQKKTQRSEVH